MCAVNPKRDFTCHYHDESHYCHHIPNTFALPVVAIVLITVLNDGTIVSIAYDRVTVSKKPESWNLPLMFFNACTCGGIALVSSIILLLTSLDNLDSRHPDPFYDAFGIPVFRYGECLTAIYMKVALSDFLTLFAARTNSWFWSRKPGNILLFAFIFATTCATFFSVYWFFNFSNGDSGNIPDMKPVSWKLAGFIWGYDIVFFMLQDIVKVYQLKFFDYWYGLQGRETGYSGVKLSDTFLIFSGPTDRGAAKRSIVTRRSMAAAGVA